MKKLLFISALLVGAITAHGRSLPQKVDVDGADLGRKARPDAIASTTDTIGAWATASGGSMKDGQTVRIDTDSTTETQAVWIYFADLDTDSDGGLDGTDYLKLVTTGDDTQIKIFSDAFSTLIYGAPDDGARNFVISGSPGTGANDGKDMRLRGGNASGTGTDGDVEIGDQDTTQVIVGPNTDLVVDNATGIVSVGSAAAGGNSAGDLEVGDDLHVLDDIDVGGDYHRIGPGDSTGALFGWAELEITLDGAENGSNNQPVIALRGESGAVTPTSNHPVGILTVVNADAVTGPQQRIGQWQVGTDGDVSAGKMAFSTTTAAGAITPAFTIDSKQNAVIGSTNYEDTALPPYRLTVEEGGLMLEEAAGTPTVPTAADKVVLYMKGDKLVVQFYDGANPHYFYLDLTATTNQSLIYSATAP